MAFPPAAITPPTPPPPPPTPPPPPPSLFLFFSFRVTAKHSSLILIGEVIVCVHVIVVFTSQCVGSLIVIAVLM